MNYTTLKSAIADWLHRSDLTAVIPTFIMLAESRINRDLRVSDMEKVVSGSVAGDITLPTDFRQVKSLIVDDRKINYLSEKQGMVYEGEPYGYSQVGGALKLYPAGGQSYTLQYYASIPSLSDAAPANWLLSKYPEIYLYASLLESAPYMNDDARMQTWAMAYQNAITTLSQQDAVRKYGDSGLTIQGIPQ